MINVTRLTTQYSKIIHLTYLLLADPALLPCGGLPGVSTQGGISRIPSRRQLPKVMRKAIPEVHDTMPSRVVDVGHDQQREALPTVLFPLPVPLRRTTSRKKELTTATTFSATAKETSGRG